jgi:hypothetical protein
LAKGRLTMFKLGEKPRQKRLYIAIASVVIAIFIVSSVSLLLSSDPNKMRLPVDRSVCESTGGVWNECGSPCLGAPQGTICIQVCQEQCEWFASNAEAINNNPVYSAQPGLKCATQSNGILMCWLAGNANAKG